jgi:hypothetical protein
MPIYVIDGRPGSGKTYDAVKKLVQRMMASEKAKFLPTATSVWPHPDKSTQSNK